MGRTTDPQALSAALQNQQAQQQMQQQLAQQQGAPTQAQPQGGKFMPPGMVQGGQRPMGQQMPQSDRARMMPSQEQLAARQAMVQQAQAAQQAQGQPMPMALPQYGKGGSTPTVQAGMQRIPQQAQPQGGKFGGLTNGQAAQDVAKYGQQASPFAGVGKGNKPPTPQV